MVFFRFTLLTCLVWCLHAVDISPDVLQSPQKLRALYSSFSSEYPRQVASPVEHRLRLSLFRKSVRFVLEQNAANSGWRSGVNMFSDMTEQEARSYEGVNTTGLAEPENHEPLNAAAPSAGGDYKYPAEANWLGSVFDPMDQGNCGSCWIFGSITAFEGRYHQLSGKLKRFSQQQMLDCVFAWREDKGCGGGANYCTYSYIKKGNSLVRSADYPAYVAKEHECRASRYEDGQKGAKLVGWVNTHPSEEGLLVALSAGVTAVSFQTTPAFRAYKSGVIRDESCFGPETTHAVAAVGYTAAYILVKNSWGAKWGESGFVKFGRNHHGCLLHTKPIYPVLASTGKRDTDAAEAPTSYTPDQEAAEPKPACKDSYPSWYCNKYRCSGKGALDCVKTCGRCSFDKDSCPGRTDMCADATCKAAC